MLAVGAANVAPFGQPIQLPFLIEGRPPPVVAGAFGEGAQVANYFAVTRSFFSTLGIPLLKGRDFGPYDTADQPLVMIINQTMARQYFPGEDPVGKRVTLDYVPDERPREIIAVVGDTSTGRLQGAHAPAIYVPHVQQTSQFAGPVVYSRIGMFFVLRTAAEPMRLLPSVKRAVAEVDPNTPVASVNTVEQTLDARCGISGSTCCCSSHSERLRSSSLPPGSTG